MASVIKAGNATDGIAISSDNTGILELKTGSGAGTTALTLDTSQNVGIGTQSPTTILNIEKSAPSASVDILVRNTGTDGTSNARIMSFVSSASGGDPKIGVGITGVQDYFWYIDNSDSDKLKLDSNGSDLLTVTSAGNVGIGTSSPSTYGKFVVYSSGGYGNITTDGQFESYQLLDVATAGGRFRGGSSQGTLGRIDINQVTTGAKGGEIRFFTCPSGTNTETERARITSGGYSKASDNGTYYNSTGTFHEFYQSANDTGLAIKAANASYSNNGVLVDISRNTTNNSFYAISYYNAGAAAYKFRVADSGTVTNTTGTYTTISDIKLKQDVVDASSQWDDIKALRIVKYRLKEYVQNDPDSKPFLGLIAQEVEQVCPSLVEEQEDEVMDEDGKLVKNGEVTKGVKTSILYMKAVKALQEAMTRIETLEAEVAALKGAAQ
jgi:hypothetical protein